MYIDEFSKFEPGTTVRLDTNISENVVDLRSVGGNVDKVLNVIGKVVEAFNTLTSMQIDVVTADNAALTTNPVVVGSSGAILLANLALGKTFSIAVAPQNLKRYLGLKYTRVGTANTTGKVEAYAAVDVRINGMVSNASGEGLKTFTQ